MNGFNSNESPDALAKWPSDSALACLRFIAGFGKVNFPRSGSRERVLRFDSDALDQWELDKRKPHCRSCGRGSFFLVNGLCAKCGESYD